AGTRAETSQLGATQGRGSIFGLAAAELVERPATRGVFLLDARRRGLDRTPLRLAGLGIHRLGGRQGLAVTGRVDDRAELAIERRQAVGQRRQWFVVDGPDSIGARRRRAPRTADVGATHAQRRARGVGIGLRLRAALERRE